jgi:hypothetical protein
MLMRAPAAMRASLDEAQTANRTEQEPDAVVTPSAAQPRQPSLDVYIVSIAGDAWAITLNGHLTGTYSRRSDAILAAVICAGASSRIGHEAEVVTQSARGEIRRIWSTVDHS